MSEARVLVIGGAGYIGSHVVKELLKNNFAVAVYDNLSTGCDYNLFAAADFVKGDINDEALLVEVMNRGFDAVIHLAAKKAVGESMENPQLYAVNNICGSINIFNAMLKTGIKNLVFSSTSAVYGNPQYLPIDENHPLQPLSFYGFTKLEIEKVIDWYARLKDFNYIVLRYFNAVGYAADGSIRGKEQNPQNLLPIIIEVATQKRDKMYVFGTDYDTPDGSCIRDYIHVEDLAHAHVSAVRRLISESRSYVINLGTNKGTSVLEMIKAAEKVCGRRINYEVAPRRSGDPAKVVATNETAHRILNWQPQYTDIEQIIETAWNMEEK